MAALLSVFCLYFCLPLGVTWLFFRMVSPTDRGPSRLATGCWLLVFLPTCGMVCLALSPAMVMMFTGDPYAKSITTTISPEVGTGSAEIEAGSVTPIYATDARTTQGHLHGLAGFRGVDVAAGCGSPIFAPFDGEVVYNGLDGYSHLGIYPQNTMLQINSADGVYELVLLHGDYTPHVGQQVKRGQPVGVEASVGWSSGCHSHITLRQNGVEINYLTHLAQNPTAIPQSAVQQVAHTAALDDGPTVAESVQDFLRLVSDRFGHSQQIQIEMTAPVLQRVADEQRQGKPIKISWYDPAICDAKPGSQQCAIQCMAPCDVMASGERITAESYGRTAACIAPWTAQRVTVVIPGVGEYKCLDRGGAIIEHGDFIWIDLLEHHETGGAPVPFGTLVYDWYLAE